MESFSLPESIIFLNSDVYVVSFNMSSNLPPFLVKHKPSFVNEGLKSVQSLKTEPLRCLHTGTSAVRHACKYQKYLSTNLASLRTANPVYQP